MVENGIFQALLTNGWNEGSFQGTTELVMRNLKDLLLSEHLMGRLMLVTMEHPKDSMTEPQKAT